MPVIDPFRPQVPSDDVVAAGLFLRRGEGLQARWLLLRGRRSGEWGFPKGHQDPGEDVISTALRETAEETGVATVAITAPPLLLRYALPNGRTKTVVYFPATTVQEDVVLSDEHREHRWVNRHDVVRLVRHPTLTRLFTAHLSRPC